MSSQSRRIYEKDDYKGWMGLPPQIGIPYNEEFVYVLSLQVINLSYLDTLIPLNINHKKKDNESDEQQQKYRSDLKMKTYWWGQQHGYQSMMKTLTQSKNKYQKNTNKDEKNTNKKVNIQNTINIRSSNKRDNDNRFEAVKFLICCPLQNFLKYCLDMKVLKIQFISTQTNHIIAKTYLNFLTLNNSWKGQSTQLTLPLFTPNQAGRPFINNPKNPKIIGQINLNIKIDKIKNPYKILPQNPSSVKKYQLQTKHNKITNDKVDRRLMKENDSINSNSIQQNESQKGKNNNRNNDRQNRQNRQNQLKASSQVQQYQLSQQQSQRSIIQHKKHSTYNQPNINQYKQQRPSYQYQRPLHNNRVVLSYDKREQRDNNNWIQNIIGRYEKISMPKHNFQSQKIQLNEDLNLIFGLKNTLYEQIFSSQQVNKNTSQQQHQCIEFRVQLIESINMKGVNRQLVFESVKIQIPILQINKQSKHKINEYILAQKQGVIKLNISTANYSAHQITQYIKQVQLKVSVNFHQKSSNYHQKSSNYHQKSSNYHQKSSNYHQKSSNYHQKSSNYHQKSSNYHQKSNNYHQKSNNYHQKLKKQTQFKQVKSINKSKQTKLINQKAIILKGSIDLLSLLSKSGLPCKLKMHSDNKKYQNIGQFYITVLNLQQSHHKKQQITNEQLHKNNINQITNNMQIINDNYVWLKIDKFIPINSNYFQNSNIYIKINLISTSPQSTNVKHVAQTNTLWKPFIQSKNEAIFHNQIITFPISFKQQQFINLQVMNRQQKSVKIGQANIVVTKINEKISMMRGRLQLQVKNVRLQTVGYIQLWLQEGNLNYINQLITTHINIHSKINNNRNKFRMNNRGDRKQQNNKRYQDYKHDKDDKGDKHEKNDKGDENRLKQGQRDKLQHSYQQKNEEQQSLTSSNNHNDYESQSIQYSNQYERQIQKQSDQLIDKLDQLLKSHNNNRQDDNDSNKQDDNHNSRLDDNDNNRQDENDNNRQYDNGQYLLRIHNILFLHIIVAINHHTQSKPSQSNQQLIHLLSTFKHQLNYQLSKGNTNKQSQSNYLNQNQSYYLNQNQSYYLNLDQFCLLVSTLITSQYQHPSYENKQLKQLITKRQSKLIHQTQSKLIHQTQLNKHYWINQLFNFYSTNLSSNQQYHHSQQHQQHNRQPNRQHQQPNRQPNRQHQQHNRQHQLMNLNQFQDSLHAYIQYYKQIIEQKDSVFNTFLSIINSYSIDINLIQQKLSYYQIQSHLNQHQSHLEYQLSNKKNKLSNKKNKLSNRKNKLSNKKDKFSNKKDKFSNKKTIPLINRWKNMIIESILRQQRINNERRLRIETVIQRLFGYYQQKISNITVNNYHNVVNQICDELRKFQLYQTTYGSQIESQYFTSYISKSIRDILSINHYVPINQLLSIVQQNQIQLTKWELLNFNQLPSPLSNQQYSQSNQQRQQSKQHLLPEPKQQLLLESKQKLLLESKQKVIVKSPTFGILQQPQNINTNSILRHINTKSNCYNPSFLHNHQKNQPLQISQSQDNQNQDKSLILKQKISMISPINRNQNISPFYHQSKDIISHINPSSLIFSNMQNNTNPVNQYSDTSHLTQNYTSNQRQVDKLVASLIDMRRKVRWIRLGKNTYFVNQQSMNYVSKQNKRQSLYEYESKDIEYVRGYEINERQGGDQISGKQKDDIKVQESVEFRCQMSINNSNQRGSSSVNKVRIKRQSVEKSEDNCMDINDRDKLEDNTPKYSTLESIIVPLQGIDPKPEYNIAIGVLNYCNQFNQKSNNQQFRSYDNIKGSDSKIRCHDKQMICNGNEMIAQQEIFVNCQHGLNEKLIDQTGRQIGSIIICMLSDINQSIN